MRSTLSYRAVSFSSSMYDQIAMLSVVIIIIIIIIIIYLTDRQGALLR